MNFITEITLQPRTLQFSTLDANSQITYNSFNYTRPNQRKSAAIKKERPLPATGKDNSVIGDRIS